MCQSRQGATLSPDTHTVLPAAFKEPGRFPSPLRLCSSNGVCVKRSQHEHIAAWQRLRPAGHHADSSLNLQSTTSTFSTTLCKT